MKDDFKFRQRLTTGAIVFLAAAVVSALLGFILAYNNVIKRDMFLVFFTILILGTGVAFLVYGIIVRGGYEVALGGVLALIGVPLLMIGTVWYVILVVDFCLALLLLLALFFIKRDRILIKRTDEKPGYKSFNEQLAEKKEQEKSAEKDLPEIKSFKD